MTPSRFHIGTSVVVDVETTGLSPLAGHRIIEIGAISLKEGRLIDEFESLVDCGRTISKSAQRINGITDMMLRNQPKPKFVFNGFRNFIGDSTLIAHNANFDRLFIRHEFERLGWQFLNHTICTLDLSRRMIPSLPNHRLETVARYLFGTLLDTAPRHRALADARLTARVFVALKELAK